MKVYVEFDLDVEGDEDQLRSELNKLNLKIESLKAISNKNDKNVLLDPSGKILSSDEFSLILSKWKNEGTYRVNFIIHINKINHQTTTTII